MKSTRSLITASVLVLSAGTPVRAYDEVQYASLKGGEPACLWCDLSGADLRNVNLSGTDLSGANLTGANMSGAVLIQSDLSGADLTGALVSGADFSGSRLAGAELDQVDLSKAKLAGAVIESAYCDWATRFPEGSDFVCSGVTVERK